MRLGRQNIDSVGVARKILRNKELAREFRSDSRFSPIFENWRMESVWRFLYARSRLSVTAGRFFSVEAVENFQC
jgi:hypothetical protein